jgi:sugar transferase (PEP-CTERM/EpsH1 system associated)
MTRVLYVAPYVPSPIRTRPWNVLRGLARRGYRVTVAALEDGYATEADRRELRAFCESVHVLPHPAWRGALQAAAAMPSSRIPLSVAFCRSRALAATVRALATTSSFDVAHVEHLRAAPLVRELGGLPAVFDAVDCLTDLFRQRHREREGGPLRTWISGLEATRLSAYEPAACRAFAHVAVTTGAEAACLLSLAPGLGVAVVPNGVDAEYFRPRDDAAPEDYTLVFSGKLSYFANEDAARYLLEEILPRLRERVPEARVILAGARPSRALRAIAARAGGVRVTGYVSDLRPVLSCACAAVCPVRVAVGVQNKVLEAMAMGLPVVATPLAARGALADAPGAALRVAADADGFARACAEVLTAPAAARAEAGAAARSFVRARAGWERAVEGFADLYASAMRRK